MAEWLYVHPVYLKELASVFNSGLFRDDLGRNGQASTLASLTASLPRVGGKNRMAIQASAILSSMILLCTLWLVVLCCTLLPKASHRRL
jgi:hypothetical protein